MKVISFCLWGDNPKYCKGALKNLELARTIYPGWDCWFYTGWSMPREIGLELATKGALVIRHPLQHGDWRMMLDRFTAIEEPEVEVMISRDCDSRLSKREKVAVDEWLASDKGFHTIHDHFQHSVPILGGLFGIKKGVFSELGRHAREWAQSHESRWQCDQDFLTQVVWPVVQHDCMNHSEFHTNIWPGKPIPLPRSGREFIGATYDENDNIDPSQMRGLYG